MHSSLKNGSHRAAVEHVDCAVVAMIDTGANEVGSAIGEKLMESQFNAISGGAAAGIYTQTRLRFDQV